MNEAEYQVAVGRIDMLIRMDPPAYSDQWEELRFLSLLVEAYEDENEPIEEATAQEVVDFMLEQRGMSRGDLAEPMGGPDKVSEFFSGKQALSMDQVRALRNLLRIPADALIDS